jgi:hypothetical protein
MQSIHVCKSTRARTRKPQPSLPIQPRQRHSPNQPPIQALHTLIYRCAYTAIYSSVAVRIPQNPRRNRRYVFPIPDTFSVPKGGKLAGIKYAVNDVDAVSRFAAALDKRAGLYCGTAERFAPYFMLAGARGYTSGAGNRCPRLTLAMYQALAAGNYVEARRILTVIRPIEDYRARAADSYNISMLKFALQVAGHDFGPVRPPLRSLTAAKQAEVRTIVEPILAAESALER